MLQAFFSAYSRVAGQALLDDFPRIGAGGIGGVMLGVLGESGFVPGGRLDSVGFARDLIPQLLDEQQLLALGGPFDFGGEGGVHEA